jgi:hypothetical protein
MLGKDAGNRSCGPPALIGLMAAESSVADAWVARIQNRTTLGIQHALRWLNM